MTLTSPSPSPSPSWVRFSTLVPDILKGLRAAVATVVPFFLAGQLGRPELAWVALGGWLGSLADPGGTRLRRAGVMAIFALCGGAAVAAGTSAVAVPLVAGGILVAVAFAASLVRALGAAASTAGNVLVVAAAVAASTSNNADPVSDGLLFAAGASWALVLSSLVWPVWTHLPVRRAVGAVYAALATYAAALVAAAATDAADWNALARQQQRAVRAAIEAAREVAVAMRARRAGESRVGANVRVLLGDAEQQFFALIAAGDELEATSAPARETASLAAAAAANRVVVAALSTPALARPADAAPALAELRGDHATRVLQAAREAAALAHDLDGEPAADPPSSASGRPRDGAMSASPPEGWRRPHSARYHAASASARDARRLLFDALSPRSPIFRHAVRVAGTAAVAFGFGRWLSPTHSAWVTVTALAVLQPFPGATITRAIERVIGTVLGSALAVAIMMTVHAPLALALLMIPLSVAAVVTRPRSYRLFVVFLTPVFVLVATHWTRDWYTAVVRIADAAAGGAIAFVAAALVAPTWEHLRLPDALARIYLTLAQHAHLTFDALAGGPRDPGAMAAARRAVGVALDEAETSLERMLAEPRRVRLGADAGVFVVTYARRLSTSLTAAAQRTALPAAAEVERARAAVDLALAGTAAEPPDLADAALGRIVRNAEILATASAPRRA